MTNPFHLRWLKGWSFQLVLMEGNINVEAYGFGICLRTSLLQGESPQAAADRLVLLEDKRRKALQRQWVRSKNISINLDATLGGSHETSKVQERPLSLIRVI